MYVCILSLFLYIYNVYVSGFRRVFSYATGRRSLEVCMCILRVIVVEVLRFLRQLAGGLESAREEGFFKDV